MPVLLTALEPALAIARRRVVWCVPSASKQIHVCVVDPGDDKKKDAATEHQTPHEGAEYAIQRVHVQGLGRFRRAERGRRGRRGDRSRNSRRADEGGRGEYMICHCHNP